MSTAPRNARDPLTWCLGVSVLFEVLVLWRLGTPSAYYFDEVHYVPAALKLLDMIPANREHPMFGKEVIAATIRLLGDNPWGWRISQALLGGLGLHAFGRLVWHATHRRRATLLATVLLATNFMWFIQSRIAMLDMTCASLCMVGLWQFAAALRASPSATRARLHLAAAAVAIGLSLGAKWSSAPALVLPGLAFLYLRVKSRGTGPIPGITLVEAAVWLGLLPLAIYWATYWPAMHYAKRPIDPWAFVQTHLHMVELQDSVKKPHPYRTMWYQWVADWRGIWYLFKNVDGAWRGVVMLGNPASMLAGLAALAWGVRQAIAGRHRDALPFVALYAMCLAMWIFNGKPVQFYYHYLLPGAFLMAALALALDDLWDRRDRWRLAGPGTLWLSVALFALFYPIISAMPLPFKSAYAFWMWLPSWR